MNEPREQLRELIRGCRISQAIYVVSELGIPDLLADGPREVDELARATESHAPSLRRVLTFLAGVGVLDNVGPQRFALTPVSALLRTEVPGSVRPSVLLGLGESHWRPWGCGIGLLGAASVRVWPITSCDGLRLRLRRGCSVRGWGLTAWGRGLRSGGATAAGA